MRRLIDLFLNNTTGELIVKGLSRCHVLATIALFLVAPGRTGTAAESLSLPTSTCGTASDQKKCDASPPLTTGTEREPEPVEPLFVRPLAAIKAGRNDSNPRWSPLGMLIAFERSAGDKKEIHIVYSDGTPVETVYFQLSSEGEAPKFFFPGIYEESSYNAGISWSPGGERFVFMSNGGEGNYDLYAQELGRTALRLTDHKEKDGQADWSPVGDQIVFVSGRTGNGDLYLLDLSTRGVTRLTQGGKAYYYPRWSRDGKKIAAMHGSNENHDIVLFADVARPERSRKSLTTWSYDDLRPVWSPDGKKIAFYSNYNKANDPKSWSIVVVASDGSDPTEGEGLSGRVVATDVIPDVEAGPAWMPDSARIVYVKNDRQEYNPLYIADIRDKTSALVKSDTKMNHDVACSIEGTIAFRAQVDQWDQIYVMKLK